MEKLSQQRLADEQDVGKQWLSPVNFDVGYPIQCGTARLRRTLTLIGKLREPSEVTSLLWYLRERLILQHSAWHMKPKKDIGTLSKARWHVTFVNRIDERERVFMPCVEADDIGHLYAGNARRTQEQC